MCVSRRGEHLWYSDTFTVPMRKIVVDWCVACGERNPVPPGREWHFSQHALDRALDMAIEADEIKRVLAVPEVTQPSGRGYPDGYSIWAAGRIALVVASQERVVVTVLWRGVVYERDCDSEPFRDN